MGKQTITIAAIGCTGEVAKIFLKGFIQQDVQLRILARNQQAVGARYPQAELVAGSMMNSADVAEATSQVDAAFLITPMGQRNNPVGEIEAARKVLAGAKQSGVKHLIYTSVLGADRARGVGILDAKYEIEKLIRMSGIPHSVIRCGSYMEDVFDPRLHRLNKGKFLFPINRARRFSFTSQKDVPRFIVRELLHKDRVLSAPLDFTSPGTYSISEVETLLSRAAGFPIRAIRRFPTFYLFRIMLPIFNLSGHRFSSVIPLMAWFDKHGYTRDNEECGALFPDFDMTELEKHLKSLWLQ